MLFILVSNCHPFFEDEFFDVTLSNVVLDSFGLDNNFFDILVSF